MFAWFGIFVVQSILIYLKKVRMHIRLGKIGFLIAIGVFLSTLYVFVAVFRGW